MKKKSKNLRTELKNTCYQTIWCIQIKIKMERFCFKVALKIVALFCWNLTFSQAYLAGSVYYDATGYIEYRAGNMPLVISAPHGGNLEPTSLPDRSCNGCVLLNDLWTKSISEGVYDEIVDTSEFYPHLVINLLHRKKFDANRDRIEATDGNPKVEEAWEAYHTFIDAAKETVISEYGRGLFLDIHGHGHSLQRIELGYLLSKSEVQATDAELNSASLIEESSIRTLVSDNTQQYSHAALVRGQRSLGTLLDRKGLPTVPSLSDPFPQSTEPYFTGGYNTQRHGSRDTNGAIDAIQIELNQEVRFDDSTRLTLINSLAQSVLEFYNLHYSGEFTSDYNSSLDVEIIDTATTPSISFYPNPASDYLAINTNVDSLEVVVYNVMGQKVLSEKLISTEKLDISKLQSGLYIVKLYNQKRELQTKKILIR